MAHRGHAKRLETDYAYDAQTQLVSVIMRESLHAVLAPHITDEVVFRALAADPDAGFPRAPTDMTPFVQGPLRDELAAQVGLDVAEGVIADLMRILRDVSRAPVGRHHSGSRLAPRHRDAADRDATLPAPVGGVRVVRLVTPDRLTRMQLTERFDGAGCISTSGDDAEQAEGLPRAGSSPPILVLDCRLPCSEVTAAATRALDVETGATVVLWGTQEDVSATLVDLPHVPERWIRCGEMTPQDLAMLCLMLAP